MLIKTGKPPFEIKPIAEDQLRPLRAFDIAGRGLVIMDLRALSAITVKVVITLNFSCAVAGVAASRASALASSNDFSGVRCSIGSLAMVWLISQRL